MSKKLVVASALICATLSFAQIDEITVVSAVLQKPSSTTTLEYDHQVIITLDKAYAIDALDTLHYEIKEVNAVGDTIKHAKKDLTTATGSAFEDTVNQIIITLKKSFVLSLGSRYMLEVGLPNGKLVSTTIEVPQALLEDEQQKRRNLINWVGENIRIGVDVRTVENTANAIAFDYIMALQLFSSPKAGGLFKAEIGSNGIVSTQRESAQNNVHIDGNLQFLWTGAVFKVIGFRLRGFDFEATQNFDTVDYTLKPQLVFSVPYVNQVVLWWHGQIGLSKPFLPPVVMAGYAIGSNVSQAADATNRPDKVSRLDGEIVWLFPVQKSVQIHLRARGFLDFENDNQTHGLLELAGQIGLNDNSALLIKYVKGSLPPTFQNSSSVSAGFSVTFD